MRLDRWDDHNSEPNVWIVDLGMDGRPFLSAPLEDAPLKKGKKFPFLRKDLVLKRALGKDSDRWGQQRCKGRAR